MIYPADEALAGFVVDNPIGLKRPPTHIHTVLLHSWARGYATTLYPEVVPVFGPSYFGMMPTNYPFLSDEDITAASPYPVGIEEVLSPAGEESSRPSSPAGGSPLGSSD